MSFRATRSEQTIASVATGVRRGEDRVMSATASSFVSAADGIDVATYALDRGRR